MAADIAIAAEEIIKTRARLNDMYAKHTGRVSCVPCSSLPCCAFTDQSESYAVVVPMMLAFASSRRRLFESSVSQVLTPQVRAV